MWHCSAYNWNACNLSDLVKKSVSHQISIVDCEKHESKIGKPSKLCSDIANFEKHVHNVDLCNSYLTDTSCHEILHFVSKWRTEISLRKFNIKTTTLSKTCWYKIWKSTKFKKGLNFWNSKFSLLFCNINIESHQVLLSNSWNFGNNIDFEGVGFPHSKIDFLFCLKSFVQDCRLLIFFEKNHP